MGRRLFASAPERVCTTSTRFSGIAELLLRPEVALPGVKGWQHVSLEVTHRLTPPMCTIVNGIFGTNIRAADGKEADTSWGQVEVRTTKNRMNLYALLEDVFRGEDEVLLLVDRKRHNRPLKTLVNKLNSVLKTRVGVHRREDRLGGEERMRTHQCASYWGAKGLQAASVVVLIPGQCDRTRSMWRLRALSATLSLCGRQGAPRGLLQGGDEDGGRWERRGGRVGRLYG